MLVPLLEIAQLEVMPLFCLFLLILQINNSNLSFPVDAEDLTEKNP